MTQPPADDRPFHNGELPNVPVAGRNAAGDIAAAWLSAHSTAPPIVRFAPSPTGRLHLGHAYSALINAAVAQATGGQFLVRIEDIDTVRCRAAYIDGLFEDLRWLGLPVPRSTDAAGPGHTAAGQHPCNEANHTDTCGQTAGRLPPWQQSTRTSHYRAALAKLYALGVLYPCRLTRAQLKTWASDAFGAAERAPRDPDGALAYSRHQDAPGLPGPHLCTPRDDAMDLHAARQTVADLLDGETALRVDIRMALARIGAPITSRHVEGRLLKTAHLEPHAWGDPVIARKDIGTSYHLSVVVDDAAQGITLVIRGEELRAATAIHTVLQKLLELPSPAYAYHGLLKAPDGEKLAKRRRDRSLAQLRSAGITRQALLSHLGF